MTLIRIATIHLSSLSLFAVRHVDRHKVWRTENSIRAMPPQLKARQKWILNRGQMQVSAKPSSIIPEAAAVLQSQYKKLFRDPPRDWDGGGIPHKNQAFSIPNKEISIWDRGLFGIEAAAYRRRFS
jgi:hypothetical protein